MERIGRGDPDGVDIRISTQRLDGGVCLRVVLRRECLERSWVDVGSGYKDWQECIKSEAPQHKVILTQPVYLGVHEVTQAQYEKVMGQNPSKFAATGAGKDVVVGLDTSTFPVEMVSWNAAAEFCEKLSRQEKLTPSIFGRVRMRQ